MARDLISKKTRHEFREWLVRWVLREIEALFDNHDVRYVQVPAERLPAGQRRSLVECYYASIDWTDPTDVQKILRAYEDILLELRGSEAADRKRYFIGLLRRDGYQFENGHLRGYQVDEDLLGSIKGTSLETGHLHVYLDRIRSSLDSDLSLAIGSIKELIEATLKTILVGSGVEFDTSDDIQSLLRKVQKSLDLLPDGVDDSKKGAHTIRRTLSNLGQIAVGIAELRNLYGTGHGRGAHGGGLQPRHGRLAVSAGAALCTFLLETFEQRAHVQPLLHEPEN